MDGPVESEAGFQAAMCDEATLAGFVMQFSLTITRKSMTGWPDKVLLDPYRGRLLVIEFKSDRGTLRPRLLVPTKRRGLMILWGQQDWLVGLAKAGVYTDVWRPRDRERIRRILHADEFEWESLLHGRRSVAVTEAVEPPDAPAKILVRQRPVWGRKVG
jgi:hypothetical protein